MRASRWLGLIAATVVTGGDLGAAPKKPWKPAEWWTQSSPGEHVRAGQAKMAKGDYDGAVAEYTKAIELSQGLRARASLYVIRTTARSMQGDHEGALADCAKALELAPPDRSFYNIRGNIKRAKGDLEAALVDYDKAIELGEVSFPRKNRGVVFVMQGKWSDAYREFHEVTRADPQDIDAALFRCAAQMRLGRVEEAKREVGEALDTQWSAEPGDWGLKLGEFLSGRIDEAALLAAAAEGDDASSRSRKCKAWFYAGIARQAVGKKAEAATCFRNSVATKWKETVVYLMGEAELARLDGK